MTRILIVDDEASIRFTLRDILEGAGYAVDEASGGDEAIAKTTTTAYPLIISDLAMPKMDGMELLSQLVNKGHTGRVIFLTARGSQRKAVEAMKAGAHDYLTKPFDVDELLISVSKALESDRLSEENRRLKAHLNLGRSMVFHSSAMVEIATAVERIADKDVGVLITGESGTGKELICQAIHDRSRRSSKGPFIKFSCAALPDTLIEATLFGHERGAYTGADQMRLGCFREATGGTLLLDEIGELSAIGQTRLLRVLECGEIQPVGGKIQKVDVRIIAATNRNLEQMVEKGSFRSDLYYRLKVVHIHLPSLKQRPEDIPPLIDHFIEVYREKFGLSSLVIPAAVREKLIDHPWPGNVRQLKHTIEQLALFSHDGVVKEVHFSPGTLPASTSSADDDSGGENSSTTGDTFNQSSVITLKQRVDSFERQIIKAALQECNNNQSETARHLGINRATLIDKIKKFGLSG
ncbi:MAG: sigma-54-dependent Fis family transcriptional regulator [Chitinivibrionales bacterium]|nr:sigma-54-dependent Fis family transcriptional regulator [Chitinivibrionales bacterium]